MLRAWRIVKRKHQNDAFSGEGARLYGGRWSSPGVPLVYTAESQSLAALEMLVNLEAQELLFHYVVFEIEFDSALVQEVESPLPKEWDAEPVPRKIRAIGDRWIQEKKGAILRVPSAIVTSEHNYVINPIHKQFAKIQIGSPAPFRVHPRLQTEAQIERIALSSASTKKYSPHMTDSFTPSAL